MKRHILIFIVTALSFWSCEATAFWGNDSKEAASGLNVNEGFDANTITTLAGTVLTQPERKGQSQHTEMSMSSSKGPVAVILGPWWYWKKQTIILTKDQDVSVTGSLAQGKDGVLYLFAQRLENRSSGETVTLRSESGKPLWSRSGSGNQNGVRQNNGSSTRRGSGMGGGRR